MDGYFTSICGGDFHITLYDKSQTKIATYNGEPISGVIYEGRYYQKGFELNFIDSYQKTLEKYQLIFKLETEKSKDLSSLILVYPWGTRKTYKAQNNEVISDLVATDPKDMYCYLKFTNFELSDENQF